MTHNPIGRARLHLLQALTHLVETRQMHLPQAGQTELVVSLEHLDDLLSGILSRLTRVGVKDRKECFDSLDEALAELDQVTKQWAADKKSILRQILDLARSYISTVRGELRFVPDNPEEEEPSPASSWKKSQRPLEHILTEREGQVIKLSAQGLTRREISTRLKIGIPTVRTHFERILKKLKCHKMTRAVAMYVAAESEEFV